MRTVIYFADMLRANLIDVESGKSPMSLLVSRLGGTYFSKCITSAPDTPRSMAIFFSGLPPRFSGVDRRSKWPGPHLKLNTPTIFDEIIERKVSFSVVDNSLSHSGLFFPVKVQKSANFFPDLESLGKQLGESSSQQEELIFIVDKSYHRAVSERFAHASAAVSGEQKIVEGIELAIEALKLNAGDQLFVLSDHGCKLSNDDFSELALLNRDRSQIFFFHSSLTGGALERCESLLAMEDVHAIVKQAISTKGSMGSFPALQIPRAREMVHVEDHVAFSTRIGEPVRKWAVFADNFEYFESLGGQRKLVSASVGEDDTRLIALAREYLSTIASDYQELNYELTLLEKGFSEIPPSRLSSWEHPKLPAMHSKLLFTRLLWRFVTLHVSLKRRIQISVTSKFLRPKKAPKTGSAQRLQV